MKPRALDLRAAAFALAVAAFGCGDEVSPLRPLSGTCDRPESLLLGEGGAVSALGRLPDDGALGSAGGCADGGAASAFFAITLTRPRQVVVSVDSDAAVRAGFVDDCASVTPECGRATRAVLEAGEHVIAVSGPPGAEIALGIATAEPAAPPPVPPVDLGTCDAPTPVTLSAEGTATIEVDWTGPQFSGRLDCASSNGGVQVFTLELAQARSLRIDTPDAVIVELREGSCDGSSERFTCRRLYEGDLLFQPRMGPGRVVLLVARTGEAEQVTLRLETDAPPVPPAHAECASAAEIELDRNVAVDFSGVYSDAAAQCRGGSALYYAFELPEDRFGRVVEEQRDLYYSLHDAQCSALPNHACFDDDLCTRDQGGDLPPGRYVLRVEPRRADMSDPSSLRGAFQLESVAKPQPPPGDRCAEAPLWEIEPGLNEQRISTAGATAELDSNQRRVWRRVRVPFRADLGFGHGALVYAADRCEDLGDRRSRSLYGVPPGDLLISVEAGWDACELDDATTLSVTAFETRDAPENDDCAGAESLALIGGRVGRVEGSLDGARDDYGTLRCPNGRSLVARGPDRVYTFEVTQPSWLWMVPVDYGSGFDFEGSIHGPGDCGSVDAALCFDRNGITGDGVLIETPGTYHLRMDMEGTWTPEIEPTDYRFILELEPL